LQARRENGGCFTGKSYATDPSRNNQDSYRNAGLRKTKAHEEDADYLVNIYKWAAMLFRFIEFEFELSLKHLFSA
jgi:hypothetical protein